MVFTITSVSGNTVRDFEQQKEDAAKFLEYLKRTAAVVETWPAWKRNALLPWLKVEIMKEDFKNFGQNRIGDAIVCIYRKLGKENRTVISIAKSEETIRSFLTHEVYNDPSKSEEIEQIINKLRNKDWTYDRPFTKYLKNGVLSFDDSFIGGIDT
jgi:hypothetical protein